MPSPKSFLIILTEKGGGDIPPVVAIACGLRDRGHRVSVICDQSTARLIASTGLSSTTYPSNLDQRGQITRWIRRLQEVESESEFKAQNPMLEWADPLVPFGEAAISEPGPDLIISTLFGIGLASQLSTSSGVPWCFVNPSFYLGDHAARDWAEDWFGPDIPRLVRDCFMPITRHADITLHATDPQFDFPPARLPENHFYVGFLLWEPQENGIEFLDQPGDPWALVTLSTVRQEEELVLADSALRALADRHVRTLLTQPDDDIRGMLSEIPANATIVGFVPHLQVLRRSSITVNHAGHGIVSKALQHGVPMVLLPWDRDQPGVAARAEKLGVADVVPRHKATAEQVQQAISAVLEESRFRDAAKLHSRRLTEVDSIAVACDLLENF